MITLLADPRSQIKLQTPTHKQTWMMSRPELRARAYDSFEFSTTNRLDSQLLYMVANSNMLLPEPSPQKRKLQLTTHHLNRILKQHEQPTK
jgi:hypothetical protein